VKKKFGTAAIVMLMLLGLRFFGQIESLMTSLSVGALVMFCIYLTAIIVVYGRKPWGAILCAVVGVTDIVTTLIYTEGASRVGAVAGDPIETLIWKTEEGKAVWRTRNTKTGETVIDGGEFQYGEIPKN